MHKVNTAAAFIKHNMPLGQVGSLSDQQAWDIALFMDSHERPQDPRYDGDISQTQKSYHGDNSQYGEPSPVDEHLLGTKAY
ncbi:cytochrome c family protein [Vibrio variabilis]|uniref:Cytochrome c family protein n=1 Tax=Vibrio variabilis TaxID=990271 RepID=A0ABQ0JKZ4_9VIBR|nr:cytochrome c family protein [Vibrio variabilis]